MKVVVDPAMRSQLDRLSEPVELCDESGRVLGQFLPALDLAAWEPMSPEISEEELDRREQETESYSTDEMLTYLKSLN